MDEWEYDEQQRREERSNPIFPREAEYRPISSRGWLCWLEQMMSESDEGHDTEHRKEASDERTDD